MGYGLRGKLDAVTSSRKLRPDVGSTRQSPSDTREMTFLVESHFKGERRRVLVESQKSKVERISNLGRVRGFRHRGGSGSPRRP